MTAVADVLDITLDVNEQESEIIRAALHRMSDTQRSTLWQLLDLVERTMVRGWQHVLAAIALAPVGIVRDTVQHVARLRYARRTPDPANVTRREIRNRAPYPPPDATTTVVGRAADPDVWTATWAWSSFAPEALDRLADWARRDHRPVQVLYRHQPGTAIGLTRHWERCADGGLDVEFTLLPTRRANYAHQCIREGTLRGLSLGTRTNRATWTHCAPSEWQPELGRLDLCRLHEIDINEVSLTPMPAQHRHTEVRISWPTRSPALPPKAPTLPATPTIDERMTNAELRLDRVEGRLLAIEGVGDGPTNGETNDRARRARHERERQARGRVVVTGDAHARDGAMPCLSREKFE
jgi:phage head maturation protease